MIPGVEARSVVARDGTRIGYQIRAGAKTDGPAIVLANGLGGTYLAFRALYQALGTDYRIVSWDYRGLYSSAAPADPRANTIPHQVDDLLAILEAEHIDTFAMVGWSMGVQVGFETIARHPDRVKGLFAINGTYGRAFQTVMGSRFVGQTIPRLLKLVRAQAGLVGRATKLLAGSNALVNAMKRFGLASETIDMEVIRVLAAGFQTIDWVIYSDLLQRLDEHDAEHTLSSVHVPVTIVTGDKDLMTPPSTAEHIHRLIPHSRMVVIRGGTHYTPVEYPQIVVDELGMWLAKIPGWELPR
ncbi:MAG TPA: alpha/beta hydrolase [Kofleriaceae bacterium]|jgi:pimeloyl-ACP methyl ester carboxylesterase